MDKQTGQSKIAKFNPLLEARLRSLENQKAFSIERKAVIQGVAIYNDSAAVSATMSLNSIAIIGKPLCWIFDANLEVDQTEEIEAALSGHASRLIAVGDDADTFFNQFWDKVGLFVVASTWEEALVSGLLISRANDTILLSPGTRPLDPFENFKERGAYFNRLINLKMGESL